MARIWTTSQEAAMKDYQKTVLIRRGSQIPGWGLTDN